MGNELKWLLKEGVGVFSRVVIFLSKIRPPHTQLVYSPCYLCMQWFCYASFCHALAYATTANGVCLHLLVPGSSCTVLLLHCFLLNITACTAAQLGGCTFERRAPFATTSFKKGGRAYFRGWAYFQEIINTHNDWGEPERAHTSRTALQKCVCMLACGHIPYILNEHG